MLELLLAASTAIVVLADGTSVPLSPWSFSYEYVAYARDSSAALAPFSRRESESLLLGKKAVDTNGRVLEIGYETLQRQRDVDGETKTVDVKVARELRLTGAGGKKAVFKVEPPDKAALVPGGKDQIVAPRSLDLSGQTLTGTRTSYCLASYTSLVECGGEAAHQVVRVEFR
jgi:hypothetical protein